MRYVLRVENVGDDSVFVNFENTTGGTGHYHEEWFDDQGNLYISPGRGQFGITINSAGAIFLSSEYMTFQRTANGNNRSIAGIKAAIKRITGETENVNSASILFSDILFVDVDPEGRSAAKYQSAVLNTKFGILAED